MKIFLIVLICVVVWVISAILSALIARKIFLANNEKFWTIVCTFFAPATLIVLLIILPFYILFIFINDILGR